MQAFFRKGWAHFGHDPGIADWARAARPLAETLLADGDLRRRWLRCGGTWFAGVNVFPNDTRGAVPDAGIPALSGQVVRAIAQDLDLHDVSWDRAQISVCLPGYPQPWDGESDAAFRFRRDRDAAHLDGLLRDAARRRRPGERHGFILGLPLNDAPTGGAPFVVYEGSHHLMRRALAHRLAGVAPRDWTKEDVTEAYTDARRAAFETCPRIEITARPGEAYLVHRLALHGVAPWRAAECGMRAVAYFRPELFPGESPEWWLEAP